MIKKLQPKKSQRACKKALAAIGIDFGGTGVKMGLVDCAGKILDHHSFATEQATSQKKWLKQVTIGIQKFQNHKIKIAGMGVGAPGFVNFQQGLIHNLTNVPGWRNVYLARKLSQHFHLPAVVDNDVNAMALGEATLGAGRGCRFAVFATLGTGVGGGIVINGELYRGAYSMAAEIGHVSIDMHGHKTPEGRGGLETYVGRQQLVKQAQNALRAGKATLIRKLAEGRPELVTPKIIAQAAAQQDPVALEIFERMAECLATAFASVTYLLQPEVIIVGGGIARSGSVLFTPLRRHLRQRLHPVFARRVRVLPARLGEQAGMIGCALLVFQTLKKGKG